MFLAIAFLAPLLLPSPAHAQGAFEPALEGQIWKQLPYVGLPTCVTDENSGDCLTPPDTALGKYYYPLAIATDLLQGSLVTACAGDNKIINYVTDQWNNRVQAFDYCGNPAAFLTTPSLPGPDFPGTLEQPEGITTDAAHHIVVSDRNHARIVIFNQDGRYVFHFNVPPGTYPTGVAVFPGTVLHPTAGTGAVAVVLSAGGASRLQIYDSAGHFLSQNALAESQTGDDAGLWGPSGVAIDDAGLMYVSDYANSRIAAFTFNSGTNIVTYQFSFGRPADFGNVQFEDLQYPYGVIPTTVGGQRRLTIADQLNQRVAVFSIDFPGPISSPEIHFLFYLDARGDLNGSPTGISQDRQGRIYAVDLGNHRIQRFEVPALAIADVKTLPAGLVLANSTFTVSAGVVVPQQKATVNNVTPYVTVTPASGVTITPLSGPTPLAPSPGSIPTPAIAPGQIAYFAWTFASGPVSGTATFTVGATGDPNPYAPDGATADPPKDLTAMFGCTTCEAVPPVTASLATAERSYAGPTTTWYTGPATVQFTATDSSNVKETRVYLTGAQGGATLGLPPCAEQLTLNIEYCATATPASNPFVTQIVVNVPGSTVIHYRSTDVLGNVEAENTRTIAIDSLPPIFVAAVAPADAANIWTNLPNVVVNWSFADSGSGMATSTSGTTVVTAEGDTTVTIAGFDNLGNGAPNRGQLGVRLDRTAPIIAIPTPVVVELTSLAGTPATIPAPTASDPLPPSPPAGTRSAASGMGSFTNDAPASGLYSFNPTGLSNASVTTVTYTATDLAGNVSRRSLTVTVRDTTGPAIVSVPSLQLTTSLSTARVAMPDLTPQVVATDLSGPGVTVTQSPAAGTALTPGSHSVTFTARDRFGNATSRTTTFTVTDQTPPTVTAPSCTEAVASDGSLWPPNHTLASIGVKGVTDADGDAVTITVLSIFQDEPTDADGDGSTAIDGFGIGTSTAQVRAERSGQRNGRVYYINFSATDPSGARCTGTVTVGVPHDQGHGGVAVGEGPLYNSTIATLPSGDDEDDASSGNKKQK